MATAGFSFDAEKSRIASEFEGLGFRMPFKTEPKKSPVCGMQYGMVGLFEQQFYLCCRA